MKTKKKTVVIKGYASQELRDKHDENPRTGVLIAKCTTTRQFEKALKKKRTTNDWLNYFTETGEPLITRTEAERYLEK